MSGLPRRTRDRRSASQVRADSKAQFQAGLALQSLRIAKGHLSQIRERKAVELVRKKIVALIEELRRAVPEARELD